MASDNGGRMFRLMVCAPMPLGTSWTRAEYRRYLMGLGIRPVPSVSDIGALLESYAATRCGVHRGQERATGAATYGTNAHKARKVLASGRPLRPPPKRRLPRRRPPTFHTVQPTALLLTNDADADPLLTGASSSVRAAYEAGYAGVRSAPAPPTAVVAAGPPWSPRGKAPDSPQRFVQIAAAAPRRSPKRIEGAAAPRRSPLRLEAAASRVVDETREEAHQARLEAARLQVETARLQAELTRRDSEAQRLQRELEKRDRTAARREVESTRALAENEGVEAETARLQAELTRRDAEAQRLQRELATQDSAAARREVELQHALAKRATDFEGREKLFADKSTRQYQLLERELTDTRRAHAKAVDEKNEHAAQSAAHEARLADAEAQLVDTSLKHAELAHACDELRLQGRKQASSREQALNEQLDAVRTKLEAERAKPAPQSPDTQNAKDLQKRVKSLERRLRKEQEVSAHAAAVLEHAETAPPENAQRLAALEASIATTLEAIDSGDDSDELLEAEQHLADLHGLEQDLRERATAKRLAPAGSSDEAEPPPPRRATPLDAARQPLDNARQSPRLAPSDDDDEGWPAPPTASDDGGRGPAYSFDVDEPPPPPSRADAGKKAPAPAAAASSGLDAPAPASAASRDSAPARAVPDDEDDSDDSGDAWPATPEAGDDPASTGGGGYGRDDTAEGVVGITAPTGGDESDSGDDWGAPSREASSSTAPAREEGPVHCIDDWDEEEAPAPARQSPLDAAVAARRAVIEADASDSSEGWPSPTAKAPPKDLPMAADDMSQGSDDSDIESALGKDAWPPYDDDFEDGESGDSEWGGK